MVIIDCHCGWKQPMEEEKQSTFEQLQEENAKLKQAIISIYTNTEEITLNGEDGYYAVKQSVIDDVIDLASINLTRRDAMKKTADLDGIITTRELIIK
ncbi:hypothetical protein AB6E88_18720 [Providencia hangzhouensis]